jgi:hypothetical protein
MARLKPNIVITDTLRQRDRLGFKEFVNTVITDSFLYEYTLTYPTDILSLDNETETLFTLVLNNKRFVFEQLPVDDTKDYIDVYLYGVKQPKDRYRVEILDESNNILTLNTNTARKIRIVFEQDITRVPTAVVEEFEAGVETFQIKGKIVEVV